MKDKVETLNMTATVNLECIRQWPSENAREWSRKFFRSAEKQPNIDAIIVVGSAARDVAESADIDFVVIYNTCKLNFNGPPIDIDIRAYNRTDVQRLLSNGHDLLGWAIRMGCVVFERGHFWTDLRNAWLNRLVLPSVEEANTRAAKAEKLYQDLRAIGDKDAADEQLITKLTHLARASLIEAGIFPASRPELQYQLQSIGEKEIAQKLADALERRRKAWGMSY
ncbi:MAG: hypothetical protein JRI95_09510 [Deltaproteobacteria bacterium]|nr:hypothetical protein [Deltaproteobacteria bacterium]